MYRQVFIKLIIILTIVSALLGCETVEQTQRGNYSATTYNLNHTSNQRNISAGQRVALIIGNANYARKEELLINPLHDADDIAKVLPNFGFKVLLHKDVDNKTMREAIAEFGRQSNNAEAALFFYSGHGVQSNNRNYLIPVTANILNEASLEYETVNLNFVLDTLDQAGSKANLVFLDACRNNPYSGVFRSSRGGAMRGLAPPSGVPSGTMIVYATDPGKSASDGEGRNGLLTAGMLEALQGRDLSLGGVLAIASKKVVALSNNEQIPYVNGPETLRTDFYFRSPQLAANAPPVTVPIVTPTVIPPLPNNDRLTELQQQRIAEEARVADLIKQRQEAEEKLRLEEARKKREAEEARVADLERQRQRKELEEANRLAEVRREREAEETRLTELTSQRKEAQQQGQDFEPEMVDIPAGCFQMGSPESESRRSDEEGPQHRVCVEAFAMGKYEITNAQFRQFRSKHNSGEYEYEGHSLNDDNQPVVRITWDDAVAYTQWLSQQTGKNYRLPSEAEWEYAARAGTTTPFWTGDCISTDQANYNGNYDYNNCGAKTGVYREKTMSVGSFEPNPWGLYDTLGNVWEWTCSEYTNTYDGNETTCKNRASETRVLRGGSWVDYPWHLRTAIRFRGTIETNSRSNVLRYPGFGVRLVRVF